MSVPAKPWSLTEHLLTSNPDIYKSATQSPFLLAAAQGKLSKRDLGKWLANDRLYIHSYIKAAGRMLDAVELPQDSVPGLGSGGDTPVETELVDWIVESLVGLRREEKMFLDVAGRYGLQVGLELERPGEGDAPERRRHVRESAKLPGLVLFETLFASVFPGGGRGGPPRSDATIRQEDNDVVSLLDLLPWLEGAVVLWGTERVYLDAWSWARAQQPIDLSGGEGADYGKDEDGGAARKEFIPNWTSPEFASFVDRLGGVLDRAVAKVLRSSDGRNSGERVKGQLLERAMRKWSELLAAETAFWPVPE